METDNTKAAHAFKDRLESIDGEGPVLLIPGPSSKVSDSEPTKSERVTRTALGCLGDVRNKIVDISAETSFQMKETAKALASLPENVGSLKWKATLEVLNALTETHDSLLTLSAKMSRSIEDASWSADV